MKLEATEKERLLITMYRISTNSFDDRLRQLVLQNFVDQVFWNKDSTT